jgi:hypothetical protein
MARKPGEVRDAIIAYLRSVSGEARTSDIYKGVEKRLGGTVARSSVRSHLRLADGTFERIGHGRYRLR